MSEYAAVCFAFVGLTCYSLAMIRHYREVFRDDPARITRHVLRVTGLICVATSLAVASYGSGWAFGSVQWAGAISVSALALVLLLSYAPRWIPRVTVAMLLAGGLLLAA